MNSENIVAVVFLVSFSIAVGGYFVQTVFEMIDLILSNQKGHLESPSMGKKHEQSKNS